MIREFNSYKYILAIEPGLDATGWAVMSEKSGALLACGIAQPFARVNATQTIAEIRRKIIQVWEKRVGFSKQPMVLALKIPQARAEHMISLSMMGGLLWASLSPKTCLMPRAPRVQPEEEVIDMLDLNSKRRLAQDIHTIPKHLRRSAYDAIGMGQWAFQKLKTESEQHDAK